MSNAVLHGTLFLVATPIGNLGEFPPLAIEILKSADKIYCENTPSALRLLTHVGITGKTVKAIHEGNESAAAAGVAADLARGLVIVYMSEAGVPCVSDPGFRLVRAIRKDIFADFSDGRQGRAIHAIGVPSAFLNALVISGLPTDSFTFVGFPPPKSIGRQKFFQSHAIRPETWVFYESCHRLAASLDDLRRVLGLDRWVCLCGELTKLHEFSITMPMGKLAIPSNPKGEWVVVVAKENYTL